MTSRDIELLPENDQAVTRASYNYYRAVLTGKSINERYQLRQIWLREIQRRWPNLVELD
jgi:hypothetical protein